MPIKRRDWPTQFVDRIDKPFPCPNCDEGRVRADASGLKFLEPTYSDAARSEDWFEAQHVVERFVSTARCDNGNCGEVVIIVGSAKTKEVGISEEEFQADGMQYARVLEPRAFYPAPPLFPIPTDTPGDIAGLVSQSFELFWTDLWSCVNKIRIATERLMDHLRVQKSQPKKHGKARTYLSLHQRILLYQAKEPKIAESLLAIKWVGNIGSHAKGDVSREKVFDVYDILADVLNKLFEKHDKKLSRVVRRLNKTKGRG